ncbi:hypothetical protein TTHERM_01100570, partial (macronuclear) [Tetrahymena thermophila SB210]
KKKNSELTIKNSVNNQFKYSFYLLYNRNQQINKQSMQQVNQITLDNSGLSKADEFSIDPIQQQIPETLVKQDYSLQQLEKIHLTSIGMREMRELTNTIRLQTSQI